MSVMKKYLHSGIGLVLLAALIWMAVRYIDFSYFFRLEAVDIIRLVPVVALIIVMRAYFLRLVLRPRGIKLLLKEWLGLAVYASLLNLVLPLRTGLSVKAIYLKRVYGLAYAEFTGLQTGLSILQLQGTVLVGLLLFISQSKQVGGMLGLAAVLLVILLPYAFGLVKHDHSNKLAQFLATAYNTFLLIGRNPSVVVKACLNIVLVLAITGLAMQLALASLGSVLTLAEATLVAVVVTILSVVNLTPGNFGIQEFAAAFVVQYVGADFSEGFIAMLLVRSVSIALLVMLSPLVVVVHRSIATANNE